MGGYKVSHPRDGACLGQDLSNEAIVADVVSSRLVSSQHAPSPPFVFDQMADSPVRWRSRFGLSDSQMRSSCISFLMRFVSYS